MQGYSDVERCSGIHWSKRIDFVGALLPQTIDSAHVKAFFVDDATTDVRSGGYGGGRAGGQTDGQAGGHGRADARMGGQAGETGECTDGQTDGRADSGRTGLRTDGWSG